MTTVFLSFNAQAQQGGFVDNAAPAETVKVTPIAEVSKLADDTKVVIEGRIVKNLGNENYEFTDGKDTITVEIDDDIWQGRTVNPDTNLQLNGEVDYDYGKVNVDVDVLTVK